MYKNIKKSAKGHIKKDAYIDLLHKWFIRGEGIYIFICIYTYIVLKWTCCLIIIVCINM